MRVNVEATAERLDAVLKRLDRPERRFLGVADAAAYASLSDESVRRLLSAGKLAALRPIKGKILIDRLELDSLVLSSGAKVRTGRGLATRK